MLLMLAACISRWAWTRDIPATAWQSPCQDACASDPAWPYFEWLFDKLMRDPAPEDLPGLLPAAWIKLQREPAEIDAEAVA